MADDTSTGKRRKITRKANKLTGVQVDYISLVPRGANLVPFRLTKSDDTTEGTVMLDLSALFTDGDQSQSSVVGILVKKSEAEAVQEVAKKTMGRDFKEHTDVGKDVLFISDDAEAKVSDNNPLVKWDESTYIVLDQIEKGITPKFDGTFLEAAQSTSFMPGVRHASDIFLMKMYDLVGDKGDKSDTVEQVEDLVDQFGTYVSSMVKAMPEDVFKMDSVDPSSLGKDAAAEGNAASGSGKEKTKKDGNTTEKGGDDLTKSACGIAKGTVPEEVLTLLKTMADEIKGLRKTVDDLKSTQDGFGEDWDEFTKSTNEKFTAVDTALGTQIANNPDDDQKPLRKNARGSGSFLDGLGDRAKSVQIA